MFALDLLNQFQSYNGTLLAAGKIYVYHLGRTHLAPVYGDHNGATVLPNPVILDDQGMAEIYLNDAFNYTVVVCDAYGAEQFSRDVYPKGMGNGESIGTQLYEGIDPICVNNDVYAISANTSRLGVVTPLYFVKDDEEETIIGFSGEAIIPSGTMNESAIGYEDGKITSYNGSAFSAGLTYTAGPNIKITDNEISGKDWASEISDASANAYNEAINNITAVSFANSASAITTSAGWDVQEYSAGANIDITNHVISGKDWSDEINDASANAYNQSIAWTDSQGYLTGVDLSEYAKTDFVVSSIDAATSGKYDTSSFSAISGSFLTAHQSLPQSADWNGATTVVNNNSAIWNNTTNVVSSNSASWGATNPQIPVTGINGIKISESGDKVVFEVSGDYATRDDLTSKQDSLTYGYHDTAISSIDSSALYDNSAHARINTLASRISDLSSNKLDESAFSDVSGSFLTALPSDLVYTADIADMATTGDINDLVTSIAETYQSTAGMTAYQTAGNYLTTADSANFYTTANESGFISEVPAGTMNESAFDYDSDNKISGYNGSAFGGSTPTYDYTDNNLISAIDTSGLYATSAGTANNAISADALNKNGTMGENIVQSSGSHNFYYMPKISPFGKPQGIYAPLQYATGACLAMAGDSLGAFYKGNEWYVSNTQAGQALRGEVHYGRGVHLSGATTAGYGFNLAIGAVSGVNSTGSWKYGHAEDAALRAVSSCDMHESAFEYDASNNITAYNGSAFKAGDEFPQSATEAIEAVTANSGTWETVTDKLDSTAFSDVSGTFLTAHQDLSDYQTTAGMTAYQEAGDYYSASNPSGFITGVDLTPYQTVEGMTAYQPVGDYLTTADSANFYTTANESGFISEVPAGTMNESAFSYDASDNITAYNGSAFKAGDEFPQSATEAIETVTANSADWNGTTDTVSSNSGTWGGSALPISAGPGIKFEMVDNTLVASTDETELLVSTATSAFTLTEPFSSFEQVKIKLRWWDKVPDNYYNVERFTNNKCSLSWTYFDNITDGGPLELAGASWTSNNGIDYNLEGGFARTFGITSTGMGHFTLTPYPLSIVGINRIAGGN